MRYKTAKGVPMSHGKEENDLVTSGGVKRDKDFVGNYFVHLSMLFKMTSRTVKHLLLPYLTQTSK